VLLFGNGILALMFTREVQSLNVLALLQCKW